MSFPRRRLNLSDESEVSSGPPQTFSPLSPGSTAPSEVETENLPDLPPELHSRQTFEFLGFSQEKAQMFWDVWENIGDGRGGFELTFMSIVHQDISRAPEVGGREDDWDKALKSMGLNDPTREAIMDLKHTEVRLTQTASFWVQDTVNMRYQELVNILEPYQRTTYEPSLRGGSLEGQDVYQQPMYEPSLRGGSLEGQNAYLRARHGPSLRGVDGEEQDLSPTSIARHRALHHAPASTALWKAVDGGYKSIIENPILRGWVKDWEPLLSYGHGDFHIGALFYFAVDREVAAQYGDYIKRRSGTRGPVYIIKVHVPNHVIQALKPEILRYPSPEWKEFVYMNRTGVRSQNKAMKRLRHWPLLIGNILKGDDIAMSKIRQPEDIEFRHLLLKADGQPASQYGFNMQIGFEIFEEHCGDTTTWEFYA